MEIWKEYDEKYSVSNFGNVYNKEKKDYCKLTNNIGYKTAFINGKSVGVHRLVGLLFLENNQNKPFINHIDGNRSNNYYKNLEWCTHSENIKHAYDTGLCNSMSNSYPGDKNPRAKKIKQYDLEYNLIKEWDYIKQASDYYGINSMSLIRACRNKKYTSLGYHWQY